MTQEGPTKVETVRGTLNLTKVKEVQAATTHKVRRAILSNNSQDLLPRISLQDLSPLHLYQKVVALSRSSPTSTTSHLDKISVSTTIT